MPSLRSVRETLQSAAEQLARQWQVSSTLWHDSVQRTFLERYMGEYEPTVSAALKGLRQLEQTIDQAKRAVN